MWFRSRPEADLLPLKPIKTLSEILSGFESIKDELTQFYDRVSMQVVDRQRHIDELVDKNKADSAQMQKASLVSENLTVLMSQSLKA